MGLMKRALFLRWKISATIHVHDRERDRIKPLLRSPRSLKKGIGAARAAGERIYPLARPRPSGLHLWAFRPSRPPGGFHYA